MTTPPPDPDPARAGDGSVRGGSIRVDPPAGAPRRDLLGRVELRAGRLRWRVRGRNPASLALRVARRFGDVRAMGLAAEMTYFATLSVLPLVAALGAGIGLVGRLVGPEQVAEMERTAVEAVDLVLSDELTRDVVAPLLTELLRSERVGVALGSVAVALFLGSRVFRAAIRALDDAYRVPEPRTVVKQYLLSLGFALGAVVVLVALLSTLVVGPLLGGGQAVADRVGAGGVFSAVWSVLRGPLVVVVAVGWLTWLYWAGPAVEGSWRSALPGAVVGVLALLLLTVGFRVYLDVAGPAGPRVETGPDAVLAVGQFIAAALASLLYAWLASAAVLLGGVVNAEWARRD